MTKNQRQRMIADWLREHRVGSQEELVGRLSLAGITATQATVSRDLLELGAVKLKREGHEVTIGFTVSPLVDEGTHRLGTIFIFKDLTEIVSLRDEMRRREHLATVGKGLDAAVSAFNDAAGSFERRLVPLGRRLEELAVTEQSRRTLEPPPRVEEAPRAVIRQSDLWS